MGHHDPERRNRFKKGNRANATARRVAGIIQPRDVGVRRTRDGKGRFKTVPQTTARDGKGRFKTVPQTTAGAPAPPRGRTTGLEANAAAAGAPVKGSNGASLAAEISSPADALAVRLADALERIRSLEAELEYFTSRPDPETDAALADAGTIKKALAIMRARDLKNGTFRRLWDRLVNRADGGDQTALREYFQKFLPRDTGHFIVGGEITHRHKLDPHGEQVVDVLCGRVGTVRGFLPAPPAGEAAEGDPVPAAQAGRG